MKQGQNRVVEFLDSEKFDDLLEQVTTWMFRLILIIGVPYFLFILKDFI